MSCPEMIRTAALRAMLCAAAAGLAAAPALADPPPAPANAPALSTGQVDGPVEIEPSWAIADPAHSAATLHTVLNNYGTVADRVIQVRCPYAGRVGLSNGATHSDVMGPTPTQEARAADQARNAGIEQAGLDLPPAIHGRATPVTADFALTDAREALGPGALVPCTLNLAHGGERIVVFTVGGKPEPASEP